MKLRTNNHSYLSLGKDNNILFLSIYHTNIVGVMLPSTGSCQYICTTLESVRWV